MAHSESLVAPIYPFSLGVLLYHQSFLRVCLSFLKYTKGDPMTGNYLGNGTQSNSYSLS